MSHFFVLYSGNVYLFLCGLVTTLKMSVSLNGIDTADTKSSLGVNIDDGLGLLRRLYEGLAASYKF